MAYSKDYFYIESKMNGKVLEAASEGSPLVVNEKKTPPNDAQLWHEDYMGNIISKSGLAIDCTSNKPVLVEKHIKSKKAQQWRRDGVCVVYVYDTTKVIDIVGANKNNNAPCCMFQYKRTINQIWNFIAL